MGRALAAEAEATLEETIGVEAAREILIAAEELDDTPESPGGVNPLLDDSSSEGGSFGTDGSSKSVDVDASPSPAGAKEREPDEQQQQWQPQETGQGNQGDRHRARTQREVGEELFAGSLEAMRVSGVDMSQVDDALSQMGLGD